MNNHKDIISFILITNSGLVCKIFRVSDNKKIVLIGESYLSSEGIQNGIVVNIELASKSVRICISEAEKKAEISIKKINVIKLFNYIFYRYLISHISSLSYSINHIKSHNSSITLKAKKLF